MKEDYLIILYYKYTHVENPEQLAMWHRGICGALGFKGRILIAKEGINGTLEGKVADVEKYMEALRKAGLLFRFVP